MQLDLKTPWHDGTRHLVFEPFEFLEELAALIPRPAVKFSAVSAGPSAASPLGHSHRKK